VKVTTINYTNQKIPYANVRVKLLPWASDGPTEVDAPKNTDARGVVEFTLRYRGPTPPYINMHVNDKLATFGRPSDEAVQVWDVEMEYNPGYA
jgi:hypothetical protein